MKFGAGMMATSEPAVYNPVSIMQYFKLKTFEGQSFWAWKTAHPLLTLRESLQVAVAEGRDLLNLEEAFTYDQLCADSRLGSQQRKAAAKHTLQKGSLESLFFHAGFLTIASYDSSSDSYALKIPNTEIEREFHKMIAEVMKSSRSCVNYGRQIVKNFNDLNFQKLIEVYNDFVRERYGMRL